MLQTFSKGLRLGCAVPMAGETFSFCELHVQLPKVTAGGKQKNGYPYIIPAKMR